MPELLRWDRCDRHLPWVRVHRNRPERDGLAHRHDFAEWCWVESGTVDHADARGRTLLGRGDLRFLRPGEWHRLSGTDEDGLLATASVPAPLFAELERRYRDLPAWPWTPRGTGAARVGADGLAALASLLAGVPQGGQERCDAEWLVAALLRLLRPRPAAPAAPAWLEEAVAAFDEPRRLAAGLPELVRLGGRSAAHLSRAVRRAYGCTATELVHRLRCRRAAADLRLTTRPIAVIAAACGYVHLGHFYRRFGALYGCAPRAYRLSALAG